MENIRTLHISWLYILKYVITHIATFFHKILQSASLVLNNAVPTAM